VVRARADRHRMLFAAYVRLAESHPDPGPRSSSAARPRTSFWHRCGTPVGITYGDRPRAPDVVGSLRRRVRRSRFARGAGTQLVLMFANVELSAGSAALRREIMDKPIAVADPP
jgi:hypothetical protein